MHILSSEQFSSEDLSIMFERADEFRELLLDETNSRQLAARHIGSKLCNLFYEPSTRTRLSFGFAADNLGVSVQGTENAGEFSSAAKGETLEDTVRVINEYGVDIIVIRHTEVGASARAALFSNASIINAGDGTGEHPTQALLDAYTIMRNHGRLDNLNIVMGGDLKHGRTVRSLAKLLARYPGNKMTFVTTPKLQINDDIKLYLDEKGIQHSDTTDMNDAFRGADVVYWTRLQKERQKKKRKTISKSAFVIDATALEILPPSATIMHPLPRLDEIDSLIDVDPRAQYFEQAGNGLYIRMALIDKILSK